MTSKPHPIDVYVGRRLKIRRKLKGFNQTQIGDAVGVSFQQEQKYERGENRISASKLWLFAEFLDVPVSYFFDGMPEEIGGTLSAGTPPTGTPTDILDSPDVLELVRSFTMIQDQGLRDSLRRLAKTMSEINLPGFAEAAD